MLKGECIGIEAIQSQIILLPVKQFLNCKFTEVAMIYGP